MIVNTRNFGHIRSPFHGLLQARGDAVISIVADLQDPPEMIREFVAQWEEGYKVVVGVKKESLEKRSMFFVRGAVLPAHRPPQRGPADPELHRLRPVRPRGDGQAARDRRSVPVLPRPHLRPRLRRGSRSPTRSRRGARASPRTTSTRLYDMAMLGITNHSKVPLRLAPMAGFALSIVALLVAVVYLVLKLAFWNDLQPGPRAARHRRLLLRQRAAVLHRHPRRVHRVDPHAGVPSPARGREGAHQLRLRLGGESRRRVGGALLRRPRSVRLAAVAVAAAAAVLPHLARLFVGDGPSRTRASTCLVPWRWALGDRPFVNEQNIAAVPRSARVPVRQALRADRGDNDPTGLVLYTRHLYLLMMVGVAARGVPRCSADSCAGSSRSGDRRCVS